MPKRGYEDFEEPNYNPATGRKKARHGNLDAILDNGRKALFRAMKVGRGFERQKLGRRQKLANEQKNSTDVARLASEVAALKVSHARNLGCRC